MDGLTLYGLFAVAAMMVCYALEDRSPWFVLAFAATCVLASVYGFLQGAWPFGLVEGVWSLVALRRWAKGGLEPSWRARSQGGGKSPGDAGTCRRGR